jgi:Flp pilus assembly pilin Flp
MVEYALLNGMIALKIVATTVGNFVAGVNWPIVGIFAAGAMLVWWSMKPRGPYR